MADNRCPLVILVIGSGGREYEIVRKISESHLVCTVYCVQGNVGMDMFPGVERKNIRANDISALLEFAKSNEIDLTIVGPEEPLAIGIVDAFEKAGLKIFGPRKSAARLETSKVFAKEFMVRHEIPTAKFIVYENAASCKNWIQKYSGAEDFPLVIKMDELAAGKGVKVCDDLQSAVDFLDEISADKFGNPKSKIIVEGHLPGEEASYIVLVDKKGNFLPLASAQDHKRIDDGDSGPNTGGMGAYSPAPVITKALEKKIHDIVRRVIKGMRKEENPFFGFLYLGLMIQGEEVYVLEFNVRLGDPETQPILARMKSSFVRLILASMEGKLNKYTIEWDEAPAVCFVASAKGYGYLANPQKGDEIFGIKDAEKTGAIVSLAGVALDKSGKLITSGGRVLGVTAKGDFAGDFAGAKKKAREALEMISFDGMHYRSDITDRAINRQ